MLCSKSVLFQIRVRVISGPNDSVNLDAIKMGADRNGFSPQKNKLSA